MRENKQDKLGRIIGFYEKIGNETHAFDRLGRFVGKYVPVADEVFDDVGRLVGKGIDTLNSLLKK